MGNRASCAPEESASGYFFSALAKAFQQESALGRLKEISDFSELGDCDGGLKARKVVLEVSRAEFRNEANGCFPGLIGFGFIYLRYR